MIFGQNEGLAPMGIEKIKILEAVLELPAKLPIQLIWPFFVVNGLDWQCCLAGSSKAAPRILIFFNCPGCQIFILCEMHYYLLMPPNFRV